MCRGTSLNSTTNILNTLMVRYGQPTNCLRVVSWTCSNCYGVVSTPMPTPSGYVRIQIQSKHHLLHRVMAIAFNLPRRTDQTTIDHIDGNPSNNKLKIYVGQTLVNRCVTPTRQTQNVVHTPPDNRNLLTTHGRRQRTDTVRQCYGGISYIEHHTR